MDIYIVDSNLFFSDALNPDGKIGQFILKSRDYGVALYAPKYLKTEIDRHREKIVRLSKLDASEIAITIQEIYDYITFVSDDLIPFEEFIKAMRLVRRIDPDDVTFVALTNYIQGVLWTGDSKLYDGLKKLGCEQVVDFNDIKRIYKIL